MSEKSDRQEVTRILSKAHELLDDSRVSIGSFIPDPDPVTTICAAMTNMMSHMPPAPVAKESGPLFSLNYAPAQLLDIRTMCYDMSLNCVRSYFQTYDTVLSATSRETIRN